MGLSLWGMLGSHVATAVLRINVRSKEDSLPRVTMHCGPPRRGFKKFNGKRT
jgi:hypothetical protein